MTVVGLPSRVLWHYRPCGLCVLGFLMLAPSVGAQVLQSSLEERLFGGQIEKIDTLGVRQFIDRVSDTRTDSAEVYFNVRGEPVAWRAWINGRYYVYWQPYGRYVVSDEALRALAVLKENRRLLEMLEGLELVEQAARGAAR